MNYFSFDIEEFGRIITQACLTRLVEPAPISIFVVGSMSSRHYVLKLNNDYDIRIIVPQITDAVLINTRDALECCIKELSMLYPAVLFYYSNRVGPARIITSNGLTSVLIHCLVMTEADLTNLPIMHRVSYGKKYQLLYGKDVLSYTRRLKLSLDGIIRDSEGIEYCIKHLDIKTTAFLDWEKTDVGYSYKQQEEPFSEESAFEFSQYSIKECTNNLRDFFIQEESSDSLERLSKYEKDMCPVFDFKEFKYRMDYYITQTKEYLKGLLLIANNYKDHES